MCVTSKMEMYAKFFAWFFNVVHWVFNPLNTQCHCRNAGPGAQPQPGGYGVAAPPHLKTRCRGHSKYVRSLFDRSYFYKMKAVINFLRWGGSAHPHTPLAGAAPHTLCFCSGIENLMGNKPVYKYKNKSKNHKNSI